MRSQIISTLNAWHESLFGTCPSRNELFPHLICVVFTCCIIHSAILLIAVGDKEEVSHHTLNIGVGFHSFVVLQALVERVPVHF